MPLGTRTYSAAHFLLELDENDVAGFFRSVDGGGVKSEILSYESGPTDARWRQLGKPKYEDVKIEVGMSMSERFYQWIEAFFEGGGERKNGAVVAADFNYKERMRRNLQDMLVSEVSLPGLDGGDTKPCYMGVTLVPEQIRFEQGSGRDLHTQVAGVQKQKLWTPSNFEFMIDGFRESCRRVTKVDGFTIKQEILEYPVGDRRDPVRVPGRLEFPNLTFYMPEADAKPLIDHFTKYVIEGKPQPDTRMKGEITYNDHEGSELCHVSLYGVDVANIDLQKHDATNEEIKQVKVEISCERMEFKYASSRGGSK